MLHTFGASILHRVLAFCNVPAIGINKIITYVTPTPYFLEDTKNTDLPGFTLNEDYNPQNV